MRLLLTTIENDCIHSKLALKNLYSAVEGSPADVSVKEYPREMTTSEIYDDIVRGDYDIVYFHTNMAISSRIDNIAELVKKAMPVVNIILGGREVSFGTRKYMEDHPQVDFVFRGYGEMILFRFVKALLTYSFDFDRIGGLAYRENDEIYVNDFPENMDYDKIPFPYEQEELTARDQVYYQSFRGDADRCAYAQVLPDRSISALPLGRVCSELRYFLIKEVKSVTFVEKWFNYNVDRAYKIWDYLISNDNGVTKFIFDVNGDYLDEETVRLLSGARKGLFEFNMDIESTNAEALDAAGRKANIYQLMYNVSKLLQMSEVKVNSYITAGLPFDTPQQFQRTFNKAYGLGTATLNIRILNLRKGTLLREEADKFGYVYNSRAPYQVIANDFMPAPELIKIKDIARVTGLYTGTEDFTQSLPRIFRDTSVKPYTFFQGLTEFIYRNDLMKKTGIKENLYRILYAYAQGQYDSSNETLKLQVLMDVIHDDLENSMSPEDVKKFDRKGWEL